MLSSKDSFPVRPPSSPEPAAARLPAAPEAFEAPSVQAAPATAYRTKLVMVPFRSGEAVGRHPDVLPLLEAGWKVKSAAPRVTTEGTKLLVVLGTFDPSASKNGHPAS